MSYHSVIAHQARSSFRAIRADYVAICNGAKDPVCAALLLDLAEAWTNHILDKKEDDTLDGVEFAGDLWFYRSEEKIMGDLFNAYGINKLRDNRRWLVDNGLLECQQIPRAEGGFTNYYRLPIEAIQAKIDALPPVKNNGRSNSKHTLKITDAPVKNNAIREIDKDSKKENKGIAPSASKPYYDAIAASMDIHGGQNVDMQKMLEGVSKKKGYAEYNLVPAMSLEEFNKWFQWAKREMGEYMVKAPAKVNGSITKYRAQASKQQSAPVNLSQRKAPANLSLLETENK